MNTVPPRRGRVAVVGADGSLKHKEDIVDGLENAPEAFLGMLDGKNFGKLLVPVSCARQRPT